MRRAAIALGTLTTFATGLGLALLARPMRPLDPATPADFWFSVFGVTEQGKESDAFVGDATVLDNVVVFDQPHFHGSWLFFVPHAELEPTLHPMVEHLRRLAEHADSTWRSEALAAWSARPAAEQTIDYLLADWDEAFEKHAPRSARWNAMDRFFLERRIQQARWYWANLLFEFVWLSGVAWFVLWPAIRGHAPWRWALHAWFTMPLLALPLYFGYATLSLTSHGPSGGVLYPFVILFLPRGNLTPAEQSLLSYIPLVLEPLSQGTGPAMVLTGR